MKLRNNGAIILLFAYEGIRVQGAKEEVEKDNKNLIGDTELKPGKVPPKVLSDIVFRYLGVSPPPKNVLLGPALGEDAAGILIDENKILIAAADPITGAAEGLGFYAIHINANDVACHGAKPKYFLATILLPIGTKKEKIQRIMQDMDQAAASLDISIVGGHTEISSAVNSPIVAGTLLGLVSRKNFVTTSGARPGDVILMTKWAGIEGTSILSSDRAEQLRTVFNIPEDALETGRNLVTQISVVKEALAASQTGYVTSMHDPTEGGLAGGLHELADSGNLGFKIQESEIPILEATNTICRALKIDPLCLISSGVLLIVVKPQGVAEVIKAVENAGVEIKQIGIVTEESERNIVSTSTGTSSPLVRPETDELWRALEA